MHAPELVSYETSGHLSAAPQTDLMRQYAGARIAFYSTQVSGCIGGVNFLILFIPAEIHCAFKVDTLAEYVLGILIANLTYSAEYWWIPFTVTLTR